MDMEWKPGFTIRVTVDHGAVLLSANRAGLRSLSAQLAALAEETPGAHIHYDEHNSLEAGSTELIVEIRP